MVSLAAPAGVMPPPPTPLQKRPTLGLKRDSSYLSTDDETGLSSSAKRLKVTFSPNVDVRIMDDWNDKSFDLVKEEVILAIERHTAAGDQRDDTQYLKLLQLLGQDGFSSEAPRTRLLKRYLLAIDTRISSLRECGQLVAAVVDLSWLGRDEGFVELYSKFLCDLSSAHAKFVPIVMQKLVSHFAKLPASLGRLPEEMPTSRATMFARLHLVIKTLLRQIPSVSSALTRIVRRSFPNDLATTKSYLQYQKHLIRLIEYATELKSDVLALVVERLVDLDVQIQQDIEDLEDDAENTLLQQRTVSKHSSQDFPDSEDSDIESVSESEETVTEDEQRLRELRLKVSKMDGTLDLLFEYYTPLIENGIRPQSNDAYQQLVTHFTTFVLPTRSRHAQFLLFHFSQTSSAHSNHFAERCLQLAVHSAGNSKQSLTACAYLASFIARGAHVHTTLVRRICNVICEYLESMRQRYEPDSRGPDKQCYGLYYALMQTLLYIFCFRWRDLVIHSSPLEMRTDAFNEDDALAEGHDLEWMGSLKETMTQNIYSRLNPLKVCSQAIVGEFAKLAHHLRFLYVFPLLETNKRLRLGQTYSYYGTRGLVDIGRRETAWDRKTGESHHQLEAYFPFDPYHLPKSKRWVASDYNEWKLPNGMQQDEVSSDDEDEEGEENYDENDEEEREEESNLDALPENVDNLTFPDAIAVSV